MTNNANLKRAARSFMEKHEGVPYLTALKAVDEPLHELRDLVNQRNLFKVYGFNLVSEKTPYRSAYDDVPPGYPEEYKPNWNSYPIKQGMSHYSDTAAMIRDMGARLQLLDSTGAADIWEYRELQRSGIRGEVPELEPFFHIAGKSGDEILYDEGRRLGIYNVLIADFLEITDRELFPLTLKQFDALRAGVPAGPLELPNSLPYDLDRAFIDHEYERGTIFHSEEEFVFHATSLMGRTLHLRSGSEVHPKMQIFFRSRERRAAEDYIRSIGLELSDFKMHMAPRGEFEIQRQGTQLYVTYKDESDFKYDTHGGGTTLSTLIV